MPARFVHICFLLTLAGLGANAQSPPARLFTQDDGLENLSVMALAQQGPGLLWIATQNGLFRYNGARFRQFGPDVGFREPGVFSLLVDRMGGVWAGTHAGLYRFDGDRFREVTYRNRSLRTGRNSSLALLAGEEIVAATAKGIFSIRRNTDKEGRGAATWSAEPFEERHPAYRQSEDTNGIGADSRGRLWFGCDEALCEFDSGALRRFGPPNGVPKDFYVSLFCSRSGRMWARGRKHMVAWVPDISLHDGKLQDVTSLFPERGYRTNFRRFTEDAAGHLFTPAGEGFAVWNGSSWREVLATGNGPLVGVSDLLADSEGSLWAGTEAFGLQQLMSYGKWSSYGSREGLASPSVLALAKDRQGLVWAGHRNGADLINGSGALRPSPLASGKSPPAIYSFAASAEGGMWAATNTGALFHVNLAGRLDYRASFDAYIRRLRVDRNGRLWAATNRGLLTVGCLDAKNCAPALFHHPNLPASGFSDLVFDAQGALWASGEQGLTCLREGNVSQFRVPGLETGVDMIALDPGGRGQFWLSGRKPGIHQVQIENGRARVLQSFARPALASDFVEFLETSPSGRVWVGTDHGVNTVENGRVLHIGAEDGLIWNDADDKTFLADDDGSVWIGTSLGLSHLIEPEAVLRRHPFAAAIDEVIYNDSVIGPGAAVPWRSAAAMLRFNALTFRSNRSLLYRYQLEGFDSKIVTTREPFAQFPNLPPGRYTLNVAAEDSARHVVSAPAARSFTITPPWWRSGPAFLAETILAMLLLASIWHWSNKALLAQRTRLQRLVQERTRELEKMAVTDGLTGLLNRAAVMAALEVEAELARSRGLPLCIALVDLDHFKRINDSLGHLAGDEVLRETARRLSASIRAEDIAGRYGGEEFLVVFRRVPGALGRERCDEIRRAIGERPVEHNGRSVKTTCSIGIAWDQTGNTPSLDLVAQADQALYQAKANGRNRVESALSVRQPVPVA